MANHIIRHIGFVDDPEAYSLPPEASGAGVLAMVSGDTGQHFTLIVDRAQALLLLDGARILTGDVVIPEHVYRYVRLGWLGEPVAGLNPWAVGYLPAEDCQA